jgi:hypothetical protein
MRLGKSTIFRLSMLGLLSGLTLATSATTAQAQWRDERHRPVFRDEHARTFVRHEDWHFDRGRGWRFEHRPGFWSPYYVWWWTGGRVVMLAAPTVTVVNYPTGQYQLRGDGITAPYYWAWMPAQAYIAAPPPPAVPAAPDMAPAGSPPPPPPAAAG